MTLVNRWYQILDLLVTHKDITLIDLQKKLSTSPKTVKNSIEALNDELFGIAEIIQTKNNYHVEISNYDEFELIMAGKLKKETDFNSTSKRVAFILKRLIEENSFVLMDDLSAELGISRGTVYNDFRLMKKLIEPYDVEVVGTPNRGMEIKGSEFNLRLLYIYHVQDYFYDDNLDIETKRSIQNLINTSGIPQYYGNLLFKVISVVVKRISSEEYLETISPCYKNYIVNIKEIEELLYLLETKYNITLSQIEQDFIWFPLNLADNKAINNEIIPLSVKNYFDLMLEKIHNTLVFDINEQDLFQEMHDHLKYMINRIVVQAKLNDLFYGEIERQYPFAYELAKVGLQEIENYMGRPVPGVEISYLALYFELALKNRKSIPVNKKIAVVCHSGKGTAMIIRRQLERVLGKDIQITHFSEKEYKYKNLGDYFAIFTTIPLKDISDKKIPVIRLTNLFDEGWLRNEWEKVGRTHSISEDTLVLKYKYLDPKRTYRDNINVMVKALLVDSIVDDKFLERIIERENQETTIFDSGIGFPHAINFHSESLVLSIGVFKNPLITERGNIEIIFLLGIPEELTTKNEQELLRIYDDLFLIVGDIDIRRELVVQENFDQLKKWLFKKGLIL